MTQTRYALENSAEMGIKMNVKNRKCIRKLSRRSLWASRRRNTIAIIAVILTTLLFTSLFTVAMSMNASYESYIFRRIGSCAHGSFKDVTKEQEQAIAAHPKVKAFGGRTNIGFMTGGVFAKAPAEISYMDENCTKWCYAVPTTGHMPEGGKEISMDTNALQLLGVEPKLGAEITLTYTVIDKDQPLFDKTDTFTLVGWWEYDDVGPVHFVNVSKEYAEAVESEGIAAGMSAFRSDLYVMMASAVDIRGQMEQVDLDLGYDWETRDEENSVRIGVNWGYTTAQLEKGMDMETVIAMLALLALVIFTGYLIIYNIFQISVTGDIRFYGLLKTIGVTPRQLRRMIRQQALLLCVAGIPAGLLAGYGVGAALTPVVMAQTTVRAGTTTSASPLIFIASALFALLTVLLSCSRPGKIAARVSPVEATKYTEVSHITKKRRAARGAKVYQMAFANLGRNKRKTFLVVISLALSVVLLNVLVSFTGGFDMEKYLEREICADFVVSSTDYFRYESGVESFILQDTVDDIEASTSQKLSGCGYTLTGVRPVSWMQEEIWRTIAERYNSKEAVEAELEWQPRRGELLPVDALIEGFDQALFEKLTVLDGDISPLFQRDGNAIAVAVSVDDYGNIWNAEFVPPVGSVQTVTYVQAACYVDSRTGEEADEATPVEFLEYRITDSYDVEYTVCAHVVVPYSMSYRYAATGYEFVLPADSLEADSRQKMIPLFYLFDTPDAASEEAAESYLAELTENSPYGLMYESKATVRADFKSFQNMFLLLGGLLCAIIGLVGVLNFFNAILTGILSRRREFAVLQSVGMTNRQLRTMLVYEGLFYALGAAAAALLLSVILNPLAGNLLEKMFWFFGGNFTVAPVLAAIPVFALLGWLIPTVMYGQSAKHSIVERLREVE